MDHHHSLCKPMQSCAEEDDVIVSDHQGLISSSNSERQSESLLEKVLSLFGLEKISIGIYINYSSFLDIIP